MKLKTTFFGLLIVLLALTQVAFALASTATGSPLTPPITTPITNNFTNLSAQMSYPGTATFNFTYNGSANYFYISASTLPNMSWDVYGRFAEGSKSPITLTNPTKWDKYSCGRVLYWQVITSSGDKSPIQVTTVNCSTSIPVGTFSNLSASLTGTSAFFNFNYSGPSTPSYQIDMSTYQDMSRDVYMGFASGYGSFPMVVINPQARWDKYSCGKTLYWRVYDSTRRSYSSIQQATINCATPSPTPTTFKPVIIKFSNISGSVNYKIARTVKYGRYSYTFYSNLPASGVTVEAVNIKTGEKFTTKTNWIGSYNLTVKNGQYKVRSYDDKKTNLTPATRVVEVSRNTTGLYFEGILNTIRFW